MAFLREQGGTAAGFSEFLTAELGELQARLSRRVQGLEHESYAFRQKLQLVRERCQKKFGLDVTEEVFMFGRESSGMQTIITAEQAMSPISTVATLTLEDHANYVRPDKKVDIDSSRVTRISTEIPYLPLSHTGSDEVFFYDSDIASKSIESIVPTHDGTHSSTASRLHPSHHGTDHSLHDHLDPNHLSVSRKSSVKSVHSIPGEIRDDWATPTNLHRNTRVQNVVKLRTNESTSENPSFATSRSVGLPKNFKLLPQWQRSLETKKPVKGKNRMQGRTVIWEQDEDDVDQEPDSWRFSRDSGPGPVTVHDDSSMMWLCSRCTVSPASTKRFAWDVLGFLFIIYDAVVIPLQFFNPPQTLFLITMQWITRSFWTMDCAISCVTGYFTKGGDIEMRIAPILKRYLTSWFVMDIAIVSTDWLEVMLGQEDGAEGMGAARIVKASKVLRAMRMVRLLRLMKMPYVVELMTEEFCSRIQSEKPFLIGGIFKILLAFVGFVHIIACLWYFVGASRDSETSGWVYHHELADTALEYRYMTSFHWSLTQFTGSMEVLPHDFRERTFNVGVLLCAWLASAVTTSIITTAMSKDVFLNIRQSMDSVKLRRYLLVHGISKRLSKRLMRNAHYSAAQKAQNVAEEDLALLALVSHPLRMELHFEIHGKVLMQHPFFEVYNAVHPAALRNICHNAVSAEQLSTGDIIFSDGEYAQNPHFYFITKGKFRYIQEIESRPTSQCSDGSKRMLLDRGVWLCEPALWTNWVHCGFLRATTESTTMRVSSVEFRNIAVKFHDDDNRNHACLYAHAFVKELNNFDAVTDIKSSGVDAERLVNSVFETFRFGPMWRGSRHSRHSIANVMKELTHKLQLLKKKSFHSSSESLGAYSSRSCKSETAAKRLADVAPQPASQPESPDTSPSAADAKCQTAPAGLI